MNALDAALQLFHKGATALERHTHPTPKDAEEALEHAKSAAKFLKSATDLMEEGIFEVADEPEASTPLPFEPEHDFTVTIPGRGRRASGGEA